MKIVELNKTINLSEHITLGEVTKSSHTEINNITSHVAIENLKRVCVWLEALRARYNQRYECPSTPSTSSGTVEGDTVGEPVEAPIIINL